MTIKATRSISPLGFKTYFIITLIFPDKISRSLQGHDVNGPSNVAERSHKIETSLKNVKKFKSETNLKTVHKTSLNDKAVPKKRKKTKRPKFPDDELKNRIADLH
ncbi:hypothetical protein DICVIV_14443, partial [Dictyocaulus viviparus]